MTRLSHWFGKLLDAFAMAAALILLATVMVVTADILLRNIVGNGFPWANEVSEYALYLMTLMAAPWLLRRGQHVRIDLVLTLVPPRVAWAMEAIADVLGFCVCTVMLRYSFHMAAESHRLGSITIKNLVFPEWWILAPLPVCFALLAIEFAFRFRRLLAGPRSRRVESISVG
jgi:TRAP-type C4-dicarboxylate transport system permease small subunit